MVAFYIELNLATKTVSSWSFDTVEFGANAACLARISHRLYSGQVPLLLRRLVVTAARTTMTHAITLMPTPLSSPSTGTDYRSA